MRIVFGFVGGSKNDAICSFDSTRFSSEGDSVKQFFAESGNGAVGRHFAVPNQGGFEVYEIVRRLENGDNVIVRARHVGHQLSPDELSAIAP